MSTKLRMRIGSETKTFVGTALLQLVDRGKLSLDTPISKYIDGVPDGNAITIRELADVQNVSHRPLAAYQHNVNARTQGFPYETPPASHGGFPHQRA